MPKLFVPKETADGETRVAIVPETIKRLLKENFEIIVEAGAGAASRILDSHYEAAGAKIGQAWSEADIIATVRPPTHDQAAKLKANGLLIGMLTPYKSIELAQMLASKNVSSIAMELIPRITRAQSMDVLSSQANIAGYKAVLIAANTLSKYVPMLMTAAGTIQPARFVIMGAGVAGLQAVATAKRLGAVIEVSDVRPAVKEQVESLGGKFIDLPVQEANPADLQTAGGYAKEVSADFLAKQQAVIAERIAAADVVITTALVPGKPAPMLVTAAMVERMKPGSVIVDLATEQGGNCELSEAGKSVVKHDVTIIGPTNLPATVPTDASTLYSRNIYALLMLIAKGGEVKLNLEDEIIKASILTCNGQVLNGPAVAR